MEFTFYHNTYSAWPLSSHLAIFLSCFAFVERFQLLRLSGECDFTFMQLDRAHRCLANRKIQFRYSRSICNEWKAKRTLKFLIDVLGTHAYYNLISQKNVGLSSCFSKILISEWSAKDSSWIFFFFLSKVP